MHLQEERMEAKSIAAAAAFVLVTFAGAPAHAQRVSPEEPTLAEFEERYAEAPANAGAVAPHRAPAREFEVEGDVPSRLPRIGVMILVAGAVVTGAGLAFFEAGCALVGGRTSWGYADQGCSLAGLGIATLGVLALAPLSVAATGWLMDGNGGYGWTLLGTVIGGLLGQVLAYAISTTGAIEGQVVPMLALPALGAVFAYELSSDPSRAQVVKEVGGGIDWRTSLGPIDGGGMASVTASF